MYLFIYVDIFIRMFIYGFFDLYFTPFSCLSPCLMIYLNFLIFLSIILLSILRVSIQHTFYLLILYIYNLSFSRRTYMFQYFFVSSRKLFLFNDVYTRLYNYQSKYCNYLYSISIKYIYQANLII